METLGISGPPTPDDSFFKRIFWPSSDSADADMLGQQGFWICLIVAVLSLIAAAFQGHLVLGVLFGLFYFFGGVGVREHDIFAAIAVTLVYLLNAAGALVAERSFPGFLTIFIAIILTSNIRGCWIASKWLHAGDPDLIPMRMNETWRDRLVDQMPVKVWPRMRKVFYVLALAAVLATLAGSIVLIAHGRPAPNIPKTTPDAVVHVQ